jgi:hypothetical protein
MDIRMSLRLHIMYVRLEKFMLYKSCLMHESNIILFATSFTYIHTYKHTYMLHDPLNVNHTA